ncbi:hypothetical protein ACH24_00445 [Francisella persica ATCC VR-331]|uniref:DUF4124 domain-containing protein n=1 Tax=Francisella persica ATCC VR-331 TaxID=1086726 RepID=A0AAC8VCN6_9GAMM|nr:DUF4124 domain-containing protein [Francisella persica]ALB01299.1 hypothetical protein ACH24_00445 [Francisella persica ATCC VR-331]ANH77590.1 hypothetical protein FSC845_03270 [Francisella persica ATCC VR-331]
MSKFYKNVFSVIACILSFLSLAKAADTKVYSWRDENGNVVFSEEKPSDEVDYKIIEVGQPTVIDTKTQQNPTNDKPVKINQSDVAKLATSELAEKNKEVLEEGQNADFNVEITSPANYANIFTKEGKIAISTNPHIASNDSPTFIINGSAIPATYEDGQWKIARPAPGENKLSISGRTTQGNEIKSTNQVTFYIKNGWLQQAKNTGNYRGN